MKKSILIILSFIIIANINSQNIESINFKWKKNPKLHTLSEIENEEQEIIILKDVSYEFAKGKEDSKYFTYHFYHVITKVNSDKAIKRNNKIYIPKSSVQEVIARKARVINSKGEVLELDEKDIKEAENEENNNKYSYFALKGIDVGSEIEYYYLLKEKAYFPGKRVVLQSSVPIKKVKFRLICPEHLTFDFKSFNGLKEVKEDENVSGKNIWYLSDYNIKALKEEKMSSYNANKKSIIYKLYKNTSSGDRILNDYNYIANYYKDVFNPEISKKEYKKIKNLLKEAKIVSEVKEADKIRKLENYIKSNFSYRTLGHDELKEISSIIDNKSYNSTGFMRLYSACLNQLEVQYEYVFTTKRDELRFDEYFESFMFLRDELFYFPSIDKYLDPLSFYTRLGYISGYHTSNFGVFFNSKGNNKEVNFIEPLNYTMNSDSLNLDIEFEESSFNNPKIIIKKKRFGLNARYNQIGYDYVSEEKMEEEDKDIAGFINDNVTYKNIKIENKGSVNFVVKPMIINAEITNSDLFVEQAGVKYLFKVGELLGPQMELYQQKGIEKQQDIDQWYNRSFYRTIKIQIPSGYKITNLNDLNFNVVMVYKNEETAFFKSKYSVEDNVIIIQIDEIYNTIHYPKSVFEKLKNVVNAAADFEKVTLVLEKK